MWVKSFAPLTATVRSVGFARKTAGVLTKEGNKGQTRITGALCVVGHGVGGDPPVHLFGEAFLKPFTP